jgi:hypothetical protein
MSQQQKAPGGHYSGANPVPTIKNFIENLDKDKKERDRQIDEQKKLATQSQQTGAGDAVPHKATPKPKSGQKSVTDPVTGNVVVIEDANKDMLEHVENPMVGFLLQSVIT